MIRKLAVLVAGLFVGLGLFVLTPAAAHAQPTSPNVFSVAAYGANNQGTVDDTVQINNAFSAADASWLSTGVKPEVYFPAGTYLLDDPSIGRYAFNISFPVDIVGHSRSDTTVMDVVEGSATGPGQTMFLLSDGGNITTTNMGADGSYVGNIDLDAHTTGWVNPATGVANTFDAGTLVHNYTNNTTMDWINAQAPWSNKDADPNTFGLRTTNVCDSANGPISPNPTKYHFGNTIENVNVVGGGRGGNTDVDVSCQENDYIAHINDTGPGVSLYLDSGTTLTDETYNGITDEENPVAWSITGPSANMTVSNVTATGTGSAGRIEPKAGPNYDGTPGSGTNTNVTLQGIVATSPGDTLFIGDGNGVMVKSGVDVNTLRLGPADSLNALTWNGTAPSTVICQAGSGPITNLVGLTCP